MSDDNAPEKLQRGDAFVCPVYGFGVVLAVSDRRGVALVRMQNLSEFEAHIPGVMDARATVEAFRVELPA